MKQKKQAQQEQQEQQDVFVELDDISEMKHQELLLFNEDDAITTKSLQPGQVKFYWVYRYFHALHRFSQSFRWSLSMLGKEEL